MWSARSPMHSPNVDHIEVVTRGDVRRAKLYYLRELRGQEGQDQGEALRSADRAAARALYSPGFLATLLP